jgi:hypothetical protein
LVRRPPGGVETIGKDVVAGRVETGGFMTIGGMIGAMGVVGCCGMVVVGMTVTGFASVVIPIEVCGEILFEASRAITA